MRSTSVTTTTGRWGIVALGAALLTGCIGEPVDQTEDASGAEKIAGMELYAERGPVHGWPAGSWWVFGTSKAQRGTTFSLGDDSQYEHVSVRGDEYLLTPAGGSRVKLEASDAPFTPSQWFGTKLALLLRHRPAGSRRVFRTTTGGPIYDPDRDHRNTDEVAHFRSPLFVDYALRGVSFPILDDWGWLSFDDMGITEPMPELLVTVVPTADPGSLTGSYDWGIKAACDDYLCASTDAERGNDESEGRIFPGEPWLGASFQSADAGLLRHLGVTAGMRIEGLVPDGPAARAGLLRDDIVTSFDGEWVSPARVVQYDRERGVGATLVLGVFRRYESTPRFLPVTLEASP